MKKTLLVLITISLIFQSCAKVFYTPDSRALASSQKIIAIVPPKVSIAARKNVDGNAMIEQQKTESINFQREMYSWMLKRKMQGSINVELQDVETTNARLAQRTSQEPNTMTPIELCNALGVDGIITSNYSLSKPMSEGAAVAVALLVGVWGATNETVVDLSIHDRSTAKMIFNYNHKASSSFGSPAQLVDNLMRQASKKMPYFTSKSY